MVRVDEAGLDRFVLTFSLDVQTQVVLMTPMHHPPEQNGKSHSFRLEPKSQKRVFDLSYPV